MNGKAGMFAESGSDLGVSMRAIVIQNQMQVPDYRKTRDQYAAESLETPDAGDACDNLR